jgi:hypothetical protein
LLNTGQSYFQGAETPTEGIKLFLDPNDLNQSIEKIQQAPLSLLGLAPDRFAGLNFQQLSFEGRVYGLPLSDYLTRCGKVDPSIPPIDEYVADVLITGQCVSDASGKIFNFINYILGKLLPIIGLFFYLLLFGMLRQFKDGNLQLLAPIAIMGPYVILGAANSRYGAPVLVFGVISLIDVISRFNFHKWSKGSIKINGRE